MTLFLSTSDEEKFANLVKVIHISSYVFGFQLNLSKGCILGINCTKEKVVALANSLECEVGICPLKYLGLRLGSNSRVTQFCLPVIERFEKILVGWKKAFFSREGWLTLINLILSSL